MGAVCSSISELSNNEPLRRLSGTEPIDPMDPFWNQLLSFSFLTPMNSADSRLFEEATLPICKNFAINNCKTGNFKSLIKTFLIRSSELKASAQLEDNIFTWQTYNALFIIRCVCKYFVEHLSEELLLKQFDITPNESKTEDGQTSSNPDESLMSEQLITSLVELLCDVPVVSCTYALQVEALNTLLVLLSIQMFQPQPAVRFSLYRYMMEGKCSIHACVLMKVLLRNFTDQEKCPAELFKSSDDSGLYAVTAAVASGLWNVLTLGFGSKQKKREEETSDAILANQSLLFILVLANHCTSEKGIHNPYREALFSFTNSQDQSNTAPTQAVATFKLDFSKLYSTLCTMLRDDQTTLLLYLLVHRNTHMKAFILSRTNTDQLVLPILKILYHAPDRNSHHIYMALIILLVLSEDEFFSKSVHEIMLKTIPWFKERVISEITLGGLLILVVIRTIQYNMTRMRDKYLHTNCLAALANMSSHFRNLHPYVAQRIVSLFAQLCRKHTRLIEQIRQTAVQDGGKEGETQDPEEAIQELAVLEEVIRMVLEILNACLSASLHHNPNLLYTLLYQKELFTPFRSHPTFQDIIQNVDTVLTYFSSKLDQNGHQLSPGEVLEVITQGALQFRRDRLKKFPELKFKYVEEDSPEEFFIPYIWSLVYHASTMYFNPARIVLFSLGSYE